ncbi:GNAT family N-acetyltransferase [Paenibacillus flagellatus]|uniref:GNAT family N-acetyltransferase n=1 Tax=Paenibacillus flagellatus TaxID=2211139 RepID=A0A2V5KA35_9BACL|nr:GNAT family N-acetyltransferase [Paenibacillus flagellatus]PYI50690.1 GNAT family N-acetyltransferase [Paenibacillus flagellatus]
MFVRPFQLSDYASITSLFNEVLSEECCGETLEAFAKQLSLDPDLVLVSVMNDEVVGIIIGTIDQRNQGYYYRIAVAPQYQRMGIGKSLINGLKQRFIQRKVSQILVTVDVHNEPILPVYEAVGYTDRNFSRSYRHLRIVSGR